MKSKFSLNTVAVAAGALAIGWSALASAQTVVMQPSQQAAPPPQPAPVIVAPQAAPPPAAAPVIVNQTAPATAPAPPPPEGVTSLQPGADTVSNVTRPNRKLLMTGLVLAGAPYVASIGIGATSSHQGDSDLFIPVVGPWLDVGARGDCPANGDCGAETGNKVLLIGDGILQTVGVLEIIGAFVFPQTLTVTTVTTASGASFSLTPSKVGREGYGLSAIGEF